MIVKPHDAPARYLVMSEHPKSGDDHYLVDLLAFEKSGRCTCPDWEHRIGPMLREGMIPDKRYCKHIIAAREAFCDDVLDRMLELQIVQAEEKGEHHS